MGAFRHRVMCAAAVAVFLAIAPAISGPLAGGQAHAQDRTYIQRFLEEAKKKAPVLVVPPPSPAEIAAPAGPEPLPLDFSEARAIMGLPTAGTAASALPGGRLAIVDLGFRGLKEWLDAHPEERALTTYFRARNKGFSQFEVDPDFADADGSDHGYWVYRVARAVLPDVPILLYLGPTLIEEGNAILHGGTQGVALFNISLGWDAAFDIYEDQEDFLAKQLRLYLPQNEAFAFISIGNSRRNVHAWMSADADGDGLVDTRKATAKRPDAESTRIVLQPGPNRIFLSWDVGKHPDSDYELQLVGPGDKVLAAARKNPAGPHKGLVLLAYEADKATRAEVRIRQLAGPASGVFMRLKTYPIGISDDHNGLVTAPVYALRENPFVIFVGAFGKTPGGGFAPSRFSDIATGPDGKLVPHVLGPGQLRLDGKELNGTSFASPFLTALYASRVGYNLKNLIERTATRSRLAKGVAAHEQSRWGIPDADKLAADLVAITGPTKIEEVSHRIEGDELVVRFLVTRCCMESLTWYVRVDLVDVAANKYLVDAERRSLGGQATLRQDTPDYVRHPVEVRIPLKRIEAARGRELELRFHLRVRTWKNPPTGSIKADEAPRYRFAF